MQELPQQIEMYKYKTGQPPSLVLAFAAVTLQLQGFKSDTNIGCLESIENE